MDFFQHQDSARRSTGFLVLLFMLAVIGLCGAIYFMVCFAFLLRETGAPNWWQP